MLRAFAIAAGVIFVLWATAGSRADDATKCVEQPLAVLSISAGLAKLNDCLDMAPPKEWWAATATQVKNAPCRRKGPFSQSELTTYLREVEQADASRESRTIHGISFENESPRLMALFEKLTTFNAYSDKSRAEGQQTFKSACKKVECAAKEIFGAKQSSQLLFMLDRFGMNGSQHAWNNADAWKTEELDDILMGLSDTPSATLPVADNMQLMRFKRGRTLAMYGEDNNTMANATMMFFDNWSNSDSAEVRQMAVLHEVGHNWGKVFGIEKSAAWPKMSDWTEKTTPKEIELEENGIKIKKTIDVKTPIVGKPQTVMSRYGLTNPGEDLAETAVAYRYNPKELQARSPEKYALMKEVVFDGLEYTSEDLCQEGKSTTRRLAAAAQALLKTPSLPPAFIAAAKQACGPPVFKALELPLTSALNADSRACLSMGLARAALTASASGETRQYPQFFSMALATRRVEGLAVPGVDAIAKGVQGSVRELFRKMIVALDAAAGYKYNSSAGIALSNSAFCKSWGGEHGYQKGEPYQAEFSDDKIFLYRNKDRIGEMLTEACMAVQARKNPRAPFTAAELNTQLVKYFP